MSLADLLARHETPEPTRPFGIRSNVYDVTLTYILTYFKQENIYKTRLETILHLSSLHSRLHTRV